MNSYKYIGSHPRLQSKTALGRYQGRDFLVQVTQRPCTINHVKWAYGWHVTPRKDWRLL